MILFSIIGALIGAGFASGQEIYLFFYRYGEKGTYGIIICSILIGIIVKYEEFLKEIYPKTNKKFLNLSNITNLIINTFLLITFFIMIAGFGAYFEQEYNINKIIGSSLLAIICYFILKKDIKGVTKVNSIVVPALIIIILLIGIISIKNKTIINSIKSINDYRWSINSIIYCSYNTILIIPVLVGISEYVKNKKHIIQISILSSIIFFALAMCIYILLASTNQTISDIQMPTIHIIRQKFPYLKNIYGLAIQFSILSTAISIGISYLKNTVKKPKRYSQNVAIMCITSSLISNIGFSNLVKILFPAYGLLGIIQIVFLLSKKKDTLGNNDET